MGVGAGALAPQLRKLCHFSGKMLKIRAIATTLERKHYEIMLFCVISKTRQYSFKLLTFLGVFLSITFRFYSD